MIKIILTQEFENHYHKLSLAIKKKAEKQVEIFRINPTHPSLHTEKLEPKGKQVWSFRIDRSYRIIFRFIDGRTALFLTVGTHDWVYKLNF